MRYNRRPSKDAREPRTSEKKKNIQIKNNKWPRPSQVYVKIGPVPVFGKRSGGRAYTSLGCSDDDNFYQKRVPGKCTRNVQTSRFSHLEKYTLGAFYFSVRKITSFLSIIYNKKININELPKVAQIPKKKLTCFRNIKTDNFYSNLFDTVSSSSSCIDNTSIQYLFTTGIRAQSKQSSLINNIRLISMGSAEIKNIVYPNIISLQKTQFFSNFS